MNKKLGWFGVQLESELGQNAERDEESMDTWSRIHLDVARAELGKQISTTEAGVVST